ncbi:MAG: hypothetical protein DRO52_03490 [Candidatus Hecatellales archaeon]|nr:MAG: hypothetical protein DRO52_03490 [Candidatus Hecatellales archaeon]
MLEAFEAARLRSLVYAILALLTSNPKENLAGSAKYFQGFIGELSKLPHFSFGEELKELLREACENPLRLKVEYTRLFVTAYPTVPCPPYESVYRSRERLTMRESTLQVLSFYRRFGLSLSEGFKEPPDHLAAELEFMHFLTGKEAEAWKRRQNREVVEVLRAEVEFASKHLAPWLPALQACVEEKGEIDFYKIVIRLSRGFVEADLDFASTLLKNSL